MNWYSFLGLRPDATTEQIAAAAERLSRQANALAVTAPERARQLRDQIRSIKQELLSGAESRQRYDRALLAREDQGVGSAWPGPPQAPRPEWTARPAAAPAPPAPPAAPVREGPGLMSRISKFLQTGWTCVDCGFGAQPADKFCAKCGGRVTSGISRN